MDNAGVFELQRQMSARNVEHRCSRRLAMIFPGPGQHHRGVTDIGNAHLDLAREPCVSAIERSQRVDQGAIYGQTELNTQFVAAGIRRTSITEPGNQRRECGIGTIICGVELKFDPKNTSQTAQNN